MTDQARETLSLGMTIRETWTDTGEAKGGVVKYASSGWASVAEFQRDRLRYFKTHSRATATAINGGIRVVSGSTVQEVTLV
jgi:hypothetical protein